MAQAITDLTKRVESALLDDPRTKDFSIEVVDNNGIITLMGKVPSLEISQAAEELTKQQEGVMNVINELEYESGQTPGAPEIPSIVPPRAPSA